MFTALHNSHSFFFTFNHELEVMAVSKAFNKLVGADPNGLPLSDVFNLVKPKLAWSVDIASMFQKHLVGITVVNQPKLQFGGSFSKIDDHHFMFIGFPQVTAIDELSAVGLKLGDFLPHDPINFYIGTIQVKESAARELEQLTKTLSRHKEELQEQVEQRTMELLHAEKMASIGTLAAGVAHEINNPLGYLNSNLNSFQDYLTYILPALEKIVSLSEHRNELPNDYSNLLCDKPEIDELQFLIEDLPMLLQESVKGCKRVSDIVQSLKTFSHPSKGELDDVDLHKCIDLSINITSNEVKYSAEIIRDFGEIPRVKANQSEVSQVIVNLLVNAAQAISNPPGEIIIKTWLRDNSHICLSVKDNGSGISKAHLTQLFTPFFTTKQVGKGTGLGLSISNNIMQQYGGSIEVESTLGEGTTFTLVFPFTKG